MMKLSSIEGKISFDDWMSYKCELLLDGSLVTEDGTSVGLYRCVGVQTFRGS
jgi:hypothetical protein